MFGILCEHPIPMCCVVPWHDTVCQIIIQRNKHGLPSLDSLASKTMNQKKLPFFIKNLA